MAAESWFETGVADLAACAASTTMQNRRYCYWKVGGFASVHDVAVAYHMFVLYCDHVSSTILFFPQESLSAKVRMGQKEKVEKMEKAHTDKALC